MQEIKPDIMKVSMLRKHYDVIFMDHMMPGMDGVETLARIKEITDSPNKDTPVIMLTANALTGMREEYLRQGFQDHISKPIQGGRLESLLLKYLPKDKVRVNSDSAIQSAQKNDRSSILVVDDDTMNLYLAEKILKEHGYTVAKAASGEQHRFRSFSCLPQKIGNRWKTASNIFTA